MTDKIVVNGIFEFEAEASDQKVTEWRGMPSMTQNDNSPHRQIIISFQSPEDVKAFAKLTGLSITDKTRSSWWPYREQNKVADLFYYDENDDIHADSDQYGDDE